MAGIKSLAKDTAIYGMSSILGRFLNWLLVPLYVHLFPPGEYGIVTILYAVTAVFLVILNYGMETGFFRFANKPEEDAETVYTTSLISVGATSALFIVMLTLFIRPVSGMLLMPEHPSYVWMMGLIVAIDAFTNIPFAYLRFRKKPLVFAGIKFANIGLNIGLNLFFLLACPELMKVCPGAIGWFYGPLGGESFGIGWIFVANVISTLCILLLLMPQLAGRRWRFRGALLRRMLRYSWPLLILGVAGILSQNMGQVMIPYLFEGQEEAARDMVGIYGANIKIAVVMVMFTQAFRYAYEPFIFARARGEGEDKRRAYGDAMKFFVLFGLLIFLAVMFFLPVLKHFVSKDYWAGLDVVPVMMVADLCFGVFFNLSLWYKLTDRTQWGMYFSLFCFGLMFALNAWLVPLIGIPGGYMGSAYAALISYFTVMVVSYFVGRKYYPIDYDLRRMGAYTLLAAVLYAVGEWAFAFPGSGLLRYASRTLLLLVYLGAVCLFEDVPMVSPRLRRLLGRK